MLDLRLMAVITMTETKKYVTQINEDNIKNILSLAKFNKSDLQKFSSQIVSDAYNPIYETTSLSEYTWKISFLFDSIQMPIVKCAELLKNIHFDNFTIETIYLSLERKEILTVADIVNDAVLDEYYTKTYDECKRICPECVFMIAENDDIDFSVMPKFDKIIEV